MPLRGLNTYAHKPLTETRFITDGPEWFDEPSKPWPRIIRWPLYILGSGLGWGVVLALVGWAVEMAR